MIRTFHHKKFAPLFLTLTFFCLLLLPGITEAGDLIPGNPKEIPWHISALSVTYDKKRALYIAEDEVVITGGKTRLEADYVEFSNETKEAFAQGNVLLISGEDSISCNAMNINLSTEKGTINKGTIYIQKNNFYIYGENIRKTGKFTYDASYGSITSCAGENPDWKITGRDIKVTIEGAGTAKHAVFWAGKVPAVYSPFLIFPVQTSRQSGLLIPRLTSSDRKGLEYEQPVYWAISRSSDATFYADYMEERGTKIGAEYRYVMDNRSKGSVFIDFLEDDQVDDGTQKTEIYSFDSTPQRTNRDRFWVRMKHNQDLGNGFKAKLDVDVVSDADYLQEFNDGFTGYAEVNEHFEKEYGRGLDEYDDTTRKNWLNISRSWSNFFFSVDALWYDDINARRQNLEDTTLQTLPAIEFNASKKEIGASGFYYTLDSEYRSFYRKDTTATLVNGQRADLYPRLSKPFNFGRYFNFEPSVGVRQTIWHTSNFTDIHGDSKDFRTREAYDIGADLSTKLIKIFNANNRYADKIKHELIPKLEYTFTPYISQDDLPSFDSLDRLEEKNLLTWSLTNNLIRRNTFTDRKGGLHTTYDEFGYIKLYQSYDIKKERDNESRPFTDLYLELELNPIKYFSIDADISWNPYDSHFKTLNAGGIVSDVRGDSFRTEYRYSTELTESLYSRLDITLTEELKAYCSIEKNLKDSSTVETQAGVSVEKACWTLQVYFSESDGDNSITFMINLHGIGEFGTK